MHQSAPMQERENTARIRIDELQGLLDTSSTEQRITARMPAVTLEELLEPEPPPPPVQVTFRRTPRASEVPPFAGAGAYDDFEDEGGMPLHDAVRMTTAAVLAGVDLDRAAVVGKINGVPVRACASLIDAAIEEAAASSIDLVIDVEIDAAIDAEIHYAEIDAAIDAVVLPTPPVVSPRRYAAVAVTLGLSFVAGILLMILLG